jgi:hypothetical protein
LAGDVVSVCRQPIKLLFSVENRLNESSAIISTGEFNHFKTHMRCSIHKYTNVYLQILPNGFVGQELRTQKYSVWWLIREVQS